ncbi:MAG TPA: MFS transporter [Acidimicrobiales bacterium]|nr:MFS transporter [Acidimicrobiales bacterium]
MDRKWWTLVVVCAATFMLLLDVTIVIVALPAIQAGLHASFSGVQWVVDAYALTLASVLLTAGSLADRYGRRLLFSIGLVVFTAGSLLCGVAQSSLMLILSRSAQGIGGAILFATSLALLAQTFHGKERGVAFGVWGAVTGVATGLGPVLGGVITTGISWRGIFLVNLPIGVLALAVTRWRVDESKTPHAARPDWAGFAVLTAGLVSLVYGLIRAGEISWTDPGTVVCLCLAAVFLAAFVPVERRAAHPMFDLALFRIPTFGGGLASAFAMNGSLFAMLLYLVLYLQDDLGYSALGTGVRLLVLTAGSLVAATVAGRLSTHMPVRWLIGPGLLLVGIGLVLMAGLTGTSNWTHLVPGFVVAGVGSGMVNPPLASTAVGVVPPQRSGMASGVNTTFRQIGIATGIAAYGSIFASTLQHHLRQSLSGTPALLHHLPAVATAIQQGDAGRALAAVPANLRPTLVDAVHSSFASTLNVLLFVSAGLAVAGAACALALIRSKDFVATHHPAPSGHRPEGAAEPATAAS